MLPQQYCLRWKHHHTNVQSMFSQLLEKERFCDVTLYCSASFGSALAKDSGCDADNLRGVSLRAHRVVLAACSELLASLLGAHDSEGSAGPAAEPVLVIDGAEPAHMRALLDYMYTGEMNVHHSQLASLLKTAEELRIKGLSDIRWSGKDEPPDCRTGAVTATPAPERVRSAGACTPDTAKPVDKFNVNGGPPPLIKLPTKSAAERGSPVRKREMPVETSEGGTPKRVRVTSRSDQTDEESHEQEWHHGNLDITAEKVGPWGGGAGKGGGAGGAGGGGEGDHSGGSWESGAANSEEEWDAPHDLASFLHTRLEVDGDNSADDEQMDNGVQNTEIKHEVTVKPLSQLLAANHTPPKVMALNMLDERIPPKGRGGAGDPRFGDVVKLNEYLLHGRRPQFWEEEYVRRVMEAVRLKELEMKQAAEILGVSYGTLYGRYRDVYGCINRPYRMKDFWTEQGPSEVLMRLQRGECTLGAAAEALSVSPHNLAAYLSGLQPAATIQLDDDPEFEPIPIEGDPLMGDARKKVYAASGGGGGGGGGGGAAAGASQPSPAPAPCPIKSIRKNVAAAEKAVKKIMIGSLSSDNEDSIPVSIINQRETKSTKPGQLVRPSSTSATASRSSDGSSGPASPSSLMRSRPDLTIVASSARHDT